MKRIIFIALFFCSTVNGQNYQRVHQKAIMVDSHNDILTASIEKNVRMDDDLKGKTHSDLKRFKEAGVDVQLFSVWCDGNKISPNQWANREMDTLFAVAKRNPDKIIITKSVDEIKKVVRQKKIAAMFGVEGGHMIEDNLENLNLFYSRGVRYMTLTWNNSTSWASSAMDESNPLLNNKPKGLNDFGKQVVKRMNELGILVDLSHVGEKTFWDAINLTTKPVLVSHSNAYALCPVFRNLKDDQIVAVGKNGGVIHLNFYAGFVDSTFKTKEAKFMLSHMKELDSLKKTGIQQEYAMSIITQQYAKEAEAIRPPLSALLDHLDYIVKLIGVDHVGMGSDFDGITSSPQQLDDVTAYPLITKALFARGYKKGDINKILGKNFLRILKASEPSNNSQ